LILIIVGIRSAEIVCNSDDSLTSETKHLNTVFIKNHSTDLIERNTHVRPNYGPNDSSNNSYTSTATTPHTRGTSETTARTLYATPQHPSRTQTHVKLNLKTSHTIDWDSATCFTHSTDHHQEIKLESRFTN